MSKQHPFGWDLPAGCTNKDIDDHFGGPPEMPIKECPNCEGSGKVMDDGAPDAVPVTCGKCKGEGEIEMTYEEAAEARQDALAEKADRQREDDIDRRMGL